MNSFPSTTYSLELTFLPSGCSSIFCLPKIYNVIKTHTSCCSNTDSITYTLQKPLMFPGNSFEINWAEIKFLELQQDQ